MSPDDPRHGKKTGYNHGCREDCCRRANMRALKRFRMGLSPKLIDATGTHRRIQALMALGWTLQEISTAAGGYTKNWTSEVLKQPRVVETTAAKVARVYDNLGMTVPEGPLRQRTRNRARANGWPPPLAWNDIDDPNERPKHTARGSNDPAAMQRHLDMAVVWRLVDEGVRVRKLSAAEASEAYRILAGRGLSNREIERRYGLNSERYGRAA